MLHLASIRLSLDLQRDQACLRYIYQYQDGGRDTYMHRGGNGYSASRYGNSGYGGIEHNGSSSFPCVLLFPVLSPAAW